MKLKETAGLANYAKENRRGRGKPSKPSLAPNPSTNSLHSKLKHAIAQWRKRQDEYEHESSVQRLVSASDGLYASNRYQGIATGTRWCLEDLEKLLQL